MWDSVRPGYERVWMEISSLHEYGTQHKAQIAATRLAENCSMSVDSVERAVRELEEKGWLTVIRVHRKRNLYVPHDIPRKPPRSTLLDPQIAGQENGGHSSGTSSEDSQESIGIKRVSLDPQIAGPNSKAPPSQQAVSDASRQTPPSRIPEILASYRAAHLRGLGTKCIPKPYDGKAASDALRAGTFDGIEGVALDEMFEKTMRALHARGLAIGIHGVIRNLGADMGEIKRDPVKARTDADEHMMSGLRKQTEKIMRDMGRIK